MKKILITSLIFTCIIIFAPAFLVGLNEKDDKIYNKNNDKIYNKNNDKQYIKEETIEDEVVAAFSSVTCFKKTYYINDKNVDVYKDNTGQDKIIYTLNKDDVVVAYKEEKGYIYCEFDSKNVKINKGWVKKNTENLKNTIYKKTKYVIDVSVKEQNINIYKNDNVVNKMKCSTGKIGYPDTETPLGIFSLLIKGKKFYSSEYNEGAKYYIKFFGNYLIHSVPVDKKGNIIEEEKDKIGTPASHGCIRVLIEDAKWIYNNIPIGSKVIIHY